MTVRNALIAVALVFGVMETIDIPDTGAPAAVFAVLFFACCIWLWRRNSRVAAIVLALQFTVEATQAHTWKHASTTTKDVAMVLGTAGILVALTFLVESYVTSRRATANAPAATSTATYPSRTEPPAAADRT